MSNDFVMFDIVDSSHGNKKRGAFVRRSDIVGVFGTDPHDIWGDVCVVSLGVDRRNSSAFLAIGSLDNIMRRITKAQYYDELCQDDPPEETAVPDDRPNLDRAYDEAMLTVARSFRELLDKRVGGLKTAVPDEPPEETAVREGDMYEVVSMSLKEYAILELRNLADLIEAGGVRLLDMGVSSPDISESAQDGYIVASAGNRWAMNISYWMKRE